MDKKFIFKNYNIKVRDTIVYQLIYEDRISLTTIGKMLGISRQRVQQIKKKLEHSKLQNWENIPSKLNHT